MNLIGNEKIVILDRYLEIYLIELETSLTSNTGIKVLDIS